MEFQVEKVAELARLNLKADEKKRLQKNVDSVLNYVKNLESLDTQNVNPTSHVLDLENVFRPDVVREQDIREPVLKHAPLREGNFFKVPKIVEKE